MDDEQGPFIEGEPLGDDEREALEEDLVGVQTLKELLGPRGIKGVVFYCPDCSEDHYLTWDLLTGNLQELLEEGESPIHEPAFNPDPEEYISWDYGRGFLDGYESYEQEEMAEIHDKLILELAGLQWSVPDVKALLGRIGLSLPTDAPEPPDAPDAEDPV
jgi:hypothetical protein